MKCTEFFMMVEGALKKGIQAFAHFAFHFQGEILQPEKLLVADEMPGLISGFELLYLDLRSQFPIIQTSRSLVDPVLQVGKNSMGTREDRRCEDFRAKEAEGEIQRPEEPRELRLFSLSIARI